MLAHYFCNIYYFNEFIFTLPGGFKCVFHQTEHNKENTTTLVFVKTKDMDGSHIEKNMRRFIASAKRRAEGSDRPS